jgi:surface polysaccharide O-acyltransferase-like enzyme
MSEPQRKPSPPRMDWLDAARVLAAVGVVLIHVTANGAGEPFHVASAAQNHGAAFLRVVAELSGAEIFIVMSAFLLAARLEREDAPWGARLRSHARRLLVPYAVWSVFFVFFRLLKAGEFGYTTGLWHEITTWQAWVKYVVGGAAEYHLHFIPTLFCVLLVFPAMRIARRSPALGLLVLPWLFAMDAMLRWGWGYFTDPMAGYLFGRLVHNLGYVGYGFAGFALYGLLRRDVNKVVSREIVSFSALVVAMAFLVTVTYGMAVASAGKWVDRSGAVFYAHQLMPVFVVGLFLALRDRAWSHRWRRLASYTFGVYLVHPIFVGLVEVACHHAGWSPAPVLAITIKLVFTVPLAFGFTMLLSRTSVLAWTVGADAPRQLAVAISPSWRA